MTLGQRVEVDTECRQRARAVAMHDDVGPVEEFMKSIEAVGGSCVKHRAAFPWQPVIAVQWQLRAVGRIDAKHVGAKRPEVSRGDRSGDHPGEIEDPEPGRREIGGFVATGCGCADNRVVDQRLPKARAPVGVCSPLFEGADRDGNPAGGHHAGFDLFGTPLADGRCGSVWLVGCAESFQQRGPVPRIVRMRPHPAVDRRPKPAQRGEAVTERLTADPYVGLAVNSSRHVSCLQLRLHQRATALSLEARRSRQRGANARDGQIPGWQSRR